MQASRQFQNSRNVVFLIFFTAPLFGSFIFGDSLTTKVNSSSFMSSQEKIYYYLEISVKSSRVQAYVNNMPVYRKSIPVTASFQSPINDLLVGEDNRVVIKAQPVVQQDGTVTQLDDMHVAGTVKRYGPDDRYSTPEGGEVIETFNLQQTLEKRRQALEEEFAAKIEKAKPSKKAELMEQQAKLTTPTPPFTMEVVFSSTDVPSFANRFIDGSVVEDSSRLIDYGVHLRDLLREKRAEDFYHGEYSVKDQDYNRAYPWDKMESGDWFIQGELREAVFPNGPMLDFDREDIGIRKWCEGRVWELYVEDGSPFGRPFIKTKGLQGDVLIIEIFVAEIDGQLTIIR